MKNTNLYLLVLSFVVSIVSQTTSFAQEELKFGKKEEASITNEGPLRYMINIKEAGILQFAMFPSQENIDMFAVVKNIDGQELSRHDSSYSGLELFQKAFPFKGKFIVEFHFNSWEVETLNFSFATSWMPFDEIATPEPPYGRIGKAFDISKTSSVNHQINMAAGINLNWYAYTAEKDGILILNTSSKDQMDLNLAAFESNDFEYHITSSDQDLRGNSANESISIPVTKNEKIYVRVGGTNSDANGEYKLSVIFTE